MSDEQYPAWAALNAAAHERWQANDRAITEAFQRGEIDERAARARTWSFEDFLNRGCDDDRERHAVILGKLNQQVQNGGWLQWIDNGYGPDTVDDLVEILDKLGPVGAKVRQMIVDIDEDLIKIENGALDALEGDEWEDLSNNLDSVCTAFYDVNDAFEAEVEAFLARGTKGD